MHAIHLLCVILAVVVSIKAETLVAIAHLDNDVIQGNVTFTQIDSGPVQVEGTVTGLTAGNYGFHVHELGDLTNGCLSTGAHFNPHSVNHGGPDHDVRHVGDLGNVEFEADNVSRISKVDSMISLSGYYSILGRGLVLHEGTDDLGLGGHEDSLTTGNAGGRIACGVIGLRSPVEPWNGGATNVVSFISLGFCIMLALLITH